MRTRASQHVSGGCEQRSRRAFTLLEMLVVLIIIVMLAALALPAIRGSLESRAIDGAARQLLEDISLARQRAISQRSMVALVFLTDDIFDNTILNLSTADNEEKAEVERLKGGIFAHYAFYQFRRVGEQPGQSTEGYVSEWKSLPEKTFFGTNNIYSVLNLPQGKRFPFPYTRSGLKAIQAPFPYIAFDANGRTVSLGNFGDISPAGNLDIAIARGALFYARNANGTLVNNTVELQEIPPLNATQNVVHVDGLTGKAQWIKEEPK
jgi:prepilin-type N-terminal cleavage/methylation domain-containing protein